MINTVKMPEFKIWACYQAYGGSVKIFESGSREST